MAHMRKKHRRNEKLRHFPEDNKEFPNDIHENVFSQFTQFT